MMFKLSGPDGLGLMCDEGGLLLAGVALLKSDGDRFTPRPASEIQMLLSHAYKTDGWQDRIDGIGAVSRALNEGEVARATIAAVFLRLPDLDGDGAIRIIEAEKRLAKAGFDLDELRDWHGRWTADDVGADGDGGAEGGELDDAAYQGDFHDELVQDLARLLKAEGCTVLTEVPLTWINGGTARADIIALPPVGGLPVVIEVKTGLNPTFTDPQRAIYPLTLIGGHVTSFDPRIRKVGLPQGKPFPPLAVVIAYQRGPEDPFQAWPLTPEFAKAILARLAGLTGATSTGRF